MLFALISPLDMLGDEYLFSAHMLQHLLLELAVPPLLLLGITPRFARRWCSIAARSAVSSACWEIR